VSGYLLSSTASTDFTSKLFLKTMTLLISGSPRAGNTDFILKRIFQSLTGDKEIIFLRNKEINYCSGCLSCHQCGQCFINDDTAGLLEKVRRASVIIIGSPNYFDNVSGLLKNFLDRTTPFYPERLLQGKRVLSVVVGGGSKKHSQRVGEYLNYFAQTQGMVNMGCYCFSALHSRELEENQSSHRIIDNILQKVCAV